MAVCVVINHESKILTAKRGTRQLLAGDVFHVLPVCVCVCLCVYFFHSHYTVPTNAYLNSLLRRNDYNVWRLLLQQFVGLLSRGWGGGGGCVYGGGGRKRSKTCYLV